MPQIFDIFWHLWFHGHSSIPQLHRVLRNLNSYLN